MLPQSRYHIGLSPKLRKIFPYFTVYADKSSKNFTVALVDELHIFGEFDPYNSNLVYCHTVEEAYEAIQKMMELVPDAINSPTRKELDECYKNWRRSGDQVVDLRVIRR